MSINATRVNTFPINQMRTAATVSFTPSVIFDDRGKLYLLVSPTFAIRL